MKYLVPFLALGLVSCSSVDDRFDDFCDEQKSLGWPNEDTKTACDYRQHGTAEQKQMLMDAWDDLKRAEERVRQKTN